MVHGSFSNTELYQEVDGVLSVISTTTAAAASKEEAEELASLPSAAGKDSQLTDGFK